LNDASGSKFDALRAAGQGFVIMAAKELDRCDIAEGKGAARFIAYSTSEF
jgi:hypothetical protein